MGGACTASACSKTALATSVTSARVGMGSPIMLSSMCIALAMILASVVLPKPGDLLADEKEHKIRQETAAKAARA